MNPYTQLDFYNQQYLRAYRNRKFGELEPHTFAIGDNAYQNMLRERTDANAKVNQCIIIRLKDACARPSERLSRDRL